MHEIAADMLEVIWRGVGNEYKSKYRQTIWQQFENVIRGSSYTNNLGRFINTVCLKFDVQIQVKDVGQLENILNSGQDKSLLKILRDETTLIVLMVRVRSQKQREAYVTVFEKKEQDEDVSI
jgi:hypothetical protein